jgi:hypothetical protein
MKRALARLGWGVILFIPLALYSQELAEKPDYRNIFGEDYEFALQTIQENSWWSDSLENHGIEPNFALAVIFPELIRYSSISDYIEVKALEVLYVQYGRDYADFSIGLFQMKPSFAERIESDLLHLGLTDSFPTLSLLSPDTIDDLQVRKARILRLKDENGQLLYLEAFLRIMDHLYRDITFETEADRLGVYAEGYNEGYWRGDQVVRWSGGQGYFYVGMMEPEKKYNYAEIAVGYYSKHVR